MSLLESAIKYAKLLIDVFTYYFRNSCFYDMILYIANTQNIMYCW